LQEQIPFAQQISTLEIRYSKRKYVGHMTGRKLPAPQTRDELLAEPGVVITVTVRRRTAVYAVIRNFESPLVMNGKKRSSKRKKKKKVKEVIRECVSPPWST
jgi:hypothetical protein